MASIQINDLQCSDGDLRDLSPEELLLQGGGFFSDLWSDVKEFFSKVDDVVHDLGGWPKVIGTIYGVFYGGGGGKPGAGQINLN